MPDDYHNDSNQQTAAANAGRLDGRAEQTPASKAAGLAGMSDEDRASMIAAMSPNDRAAMLAALMSADDSASMIAAMSPNDKAAMLAALMQLVTAEERAAFCGALPRAEPTAVVADTVAAGSVPDSAPAFSPDPQVNQWERAQTACTSTQCSTPSTPRVAAENPESDLTPRKAKQKVESLKEQLDLVQSAGREQVEGLQTQLEQLQAELEELRGVAGKEHMLGKMKSFRDTSSPGKVGGWTKSQIVIEKGKPSGTIESRLTDEEKASLLKLHGSIEKAYMFVKQADGKKKSKRSDTTLVNSLLTTDSVAVFRWDSEMLDRVYKWCKTTGKKQSPGGKEPATQAGQRGSFFRQSSPLRQQDAEKYPFRDFKNDDFGLNSATGREMLKTPNWPKTMIGAMGAVKAVGKIKNFSMKGRAKNAAAAAAQVERLDFVNRKPNTQLPPNVAHTGKTQPIPKLAWAHKNRVIGGTV